MNNQIKLVQYPVIQHALIEVGKSVTDRLFNLNIENTIATIDTVKGLKELRAELNKELADFESQRKFIKEGVLSPYNEFESVYKSEVSDKYKSAIDTLKDKIAIVEDKIKEDKRESVKSYFVELCLSEDIDFVSFPQVGFEINLSTSEKAYKEKCNEFIQKIVSDLTLINTQEHKTDILVEYKRTLNVSKSITDVQERFEAKRREEERARLNEIQRRTTVAHKLCLVFKPFTRTWEHVSDENIFIENSFLENSTREEFADKVIEIEEAIKAKKAAEARQEPIIISGPPIQQPPRRIDEMQAPEPLKAPVIESKHTEEPLKEASFTVTGTLTQLRALGQYMKENNLIYKNI